MAAYPTIPISLPLDEEGPDYQVIETEMELGYIQTRPKTTVAPRVWGFSHKLCTAAERATWLAFWNARRGGAEAFTFVIPADGSLVNVRFNQKTPMITRTAAFQRYDITVRLKEAL